MSTVALVPVDEYLRRTEKPYCEYIDGVLCPKPMPTALHGLLQLLLAQLLTRAGLKAAPEITVRLSPTKYLIPDVIAAKHIQDPYPTEPVLLCVEILSPEDGLGATLAKCEQYHTWGVPYCWVIDPMKRTAWEYPAGGEPARVTELKAGEISVDVDELFAQLKAAAE
jgi:Uma2 family endonuclease